MNRPVQGSLLECKFATNNMLEYLTLNNISVSIIVISFIYFIYQVIKVWKLYYIFDKANKSDDSLRELSTTKMSQILLGYEKCLNIEINSTKKTNIPSSEFFSEHNVLNIGRVNLRMLDAASGILVGLGLLGTFLGLTLGIDGIDVSNTENIQNSIQVLLNGMGTAFLTSLAGMGLSLLFTAIDKSCRNHLFRQLRILTDKLDAEYYIDDITLSSLKQQQIIDGLYTNILQTLEDQIKHIIEKNESNTKILLEKLAYTNDENQSVSIANAIREILTENTQQTKALKSFSTDLAIELNNGFDESLSRQMQQKILPLMENVDVTTKAIVEHIDQMANQVASPATDMMQKVVEELKYSMTSIINEFKSNISDSATNELENLALQLGTAAQAMADFPTNMGNISATLQVTIDEVKNAVSEISNTSANANSTAMQQMQEQITFATGAISNAITEVKDVMSSITHSSQEQSNQMIEKMADAAEKMSEYLNNTVSTLSSSVTDSMQGITEDISRRQENLLIQQQNMMDKIEDTMNGISQSSQEQSNQMVGKLAEATEKMGNFLNGTISTLSSSVQDSMKNITDDVNSKQADLIALQEDTIQQTRRLLDTFNHGLERLEKMNEYVTGTMDMFQQAQGQITGSTAHLQTITGDMKQATQLFNKSQSDYSLKMEEMQRNSQRGIDAVTHLLNSSGEMSQEYVEKFEIIKQGIGSIFTQIQAGLSEYSRTVQTNTQVFLDKYSSSLKDTTDALASAIQLQNEVVENLVETLNSRKR